MVYKIVIILEMDCSLFLKIFFIPLLKIHENYALGMIYYFVIGGPPKLIFSQNCIFQPIPN